MKQLNLAQLIGMRFEPLIKFGVQFDKKNKKINEMTRLLIEQQD
jgi:hypothetical protein